MGENLQLALYDDQAASYDEFASGSPSWVHIEAPAFKECLTPYINSSTTALDIGCGAGRLTKHLVTCGVKEENITGVDLSEKMLNFARTKLPDATFVQQDIRILDLSYKEFDVVTANMVFESLDNEQLFETLCRVRRHMKTGAVLVYVTTHPLRHFKPGDVYLDRTWVEVTAPWGSKLTDFYRPVGDFVNSTHKANFHIKKMQEVGMPTAVLDDATREQYGKCPAIRLVVTAEAV